tara:strand:+ start:6043 stop:6285 length:243 start_codon:yes stop_codon:yes gene_type:complete
MKFVLVLMIFFAGENNPKMFRYAYIDFDTETSCVLFKEKNKKLLEETISVQFKNVEYQEMQCWTFMEWLKEFERVKGVEA